MEHKIVDFTKLIGKLDGFSANQVEAHLGLYAGYVKKLNEIETKLVTADRGLTNYSFGEYSELKRREAVAFNGAYLHQYYFENLTPEKGTKMTADFEKSIIDSFGSTELYLKDLKAAASATPGWIVTTKSSIDGKLHNYMMQEHHIGFPVHQELVLALDCWEHAFMIDYGTKKADYLEAFVRNVDWNLVSNRFSAK
jgi:Fe-Mn family superoxide dismutase